MGFCFAALLVAVLPLRGTLGVRCDGAQQDAGVQNSGAVAGGVRELVVTTWNIISFSRAKNAFEFSGPSQPDFQALEASAMRLDNETKTVSQYIGAVRVQQVESALAECEAFEVESIKEKCLGESREQTSERLKERVQVKVQDFWKAMGGPKQKLSTLNPKWQKRGFNDEFNCNPLSKNGPLSPDRFEFTDVADMMLFDMILKATYASVKRSHPSLDATRQSICENMFSADGPQKRMASVMRVLAAFGTDVGFLNEIPKMWLAPAPDGASGSSPLQVEAAKHGFAVLSQTPDNLDKDDNTVILINESSWQGPLVSPVAHRAVGGADIKGLSVELVPVGMTEAVTLLGMHLSSSSNEERKAGLEFAADFAGALVAAADTNGEPRSSSYVQYDKGGKPQSFFCEPTPKKGPHPLHRATEAPWTDERPNEELEAGSAELRRIPAYGTCNKVRTALQPQLRKAGKLDRLMKDNIYYKSGPTVTVEQLDLCSGSDCERYTYGGKMKCFSVRPTPEEEPLYPEAQKAFPTTCGYLGDDTRLPDTTQDWGISDHSPVTAKLRLADS